MRFFLWILVFLTAAPAAITAGPAAFLDQSSLIEDDSDILPRHIFIRVVRNAGQIFAGTVLQLEHHNSNSSNALGTTLIRFRVDEAIRGVQKGQLLDVTEWAGLWMSGRERYHPGEHVLLFLYPPSKLGLTSPVGRSGRLAIDRDGNVLLKSNRRRLRTVEMRMMIKAIRQREEE